MRGTAVKTLTILLLALPFRAAAQEGLRDRDPLLDEAKRIHDDIRKASFHFGPVYLISRLEIADIGFSDEFFTTTGEDGRGLTLSLQAFNRVYFVPSKKFMLSADVTPSYSIVTGHSDGNQGGYRTRADAHFLFNHLYLDVYGERHDEVRALRGEISRLATVRAGEGGVAGEFKYSSRTSVIFRSSSRNLEHPTDRLQPDDINTTVLDRSEINHRVAVRHKTFGRTSLLAAAERSRYSFDTSTQKNGVRSYAGGGFLYDGDGRSLRVEAGRARLDFTAAAERDFSGLLGNATADQRIGRRMTLRAHAVRDVDFSVFERNNYYVSEFVSAALEFQTTRNLVLRLIAQSGRDHYDLPSANGVLRADRTRYEAVGWMYELRRFQAGFDIGIFDRDSNIAAFDEKDGIRIVLHLSFSP